jgi:ABC-type lipoprotein release transport system permease subunit
MSSVDIRLIRRNLSASKIRLFLTSVSIVLGVGFITASFVLADGLRDSFQRLSATVNQGADLTVRGEDQLGVRAPLSDSLLASIRKVEGVEAVYGQVETTRIQKRWNRSHHGRATTIGFCLDRECQRTIHDRFRTCPTSVGGIFA